MMLWSIFFVPLIQDFKTEKFQLGTRCKICADKTKVLIKRSLHFYNNKYSPLICMSMNPGAIKRPPQSTVISASNCSS